MPVDITFALWNVNANTLLIALVNDVGRHLYILASKEEVTALKSADALPLLINARLAESLLEESPLQVKSFVAFPVIVDFMARLGLKKSLEKPLRKLPLSLFRKFL